MPERSDPLWTAREALAATAGRLAGGEDWRATGVSIDTRSIRPGDLFVALQDARDGHDFVPDAMARGACAALVSREDCGPGPKLVVDDALEGLRALARAARDRSRAIRAAVTGSAGKTSVKDALAAVFAAAGPAHWSERSYNNQWGVPLSLARMPKATQRAAFEMGMNHAGEIRALSTLVRPHVAVITLIAPAHIEHLGSLEGIARAKAEIFEGLAPDGVAVIPAEGEQAELLLSLAKKSAAGFILDFGFRAGAAVQVQAYETGPDGGRGRVSVLGKQVDFRIAATGAHWAMNAAAVFAAAIAAGIDAEAAAQALASVGAAAGRGQVRRITLPGGGAATLIDDSYNANPVSMAAGVATLGATAPGPGGRRIAVLGEMLELGASAPAFHAALAGPLQAARTDLALLSGAGMRHLHAALPAPMRAGLADNAEAALSMLTDMLRDGDVVLVKGSNASGVHRLAAALASGAAFDRQEA